MRIGGAAAPSPAAGAAEALPGPGAAAPADEAPGAAESSHPAARASAAAQAARRRRVERVRHMAAILGRRGRYLKRLRAGAVRAARREGRLTTPVPRGTVDAQSNTEPGTGKAVQIRRGPAAVSEDERPDCLVTALRGGKAGPSRTNRKPEDLSRPPRRQAFLADRIGRHEGVFPFGPRARPKGFSFRPCRGPFGTADHRRTRGNTNRDADRRPRAGREEGAPPCCQEHLLSC